MDYVVGQRWVSHADSRLGLGIIAELEGRRVTVSFPAVGEQRSYAADNAPLTRLRYRPGEQIQTLDEVVLTLTEVDDVQGLLCYTGLDPQGLEHSITELELDCFVHLVTPQQRLLNGQLDRNTAFALRVATLEQLNRLQQTPARGLLGARTSLLPHQLYIAAEVGRRHAPRVLLADEVGLGKTIEAGMIIQQQLLSGRAARVLILVPDSLLHQWLLEMLRRFNLRFALFDAERIAAVETGNPFDSAQLVLCCLSLFERQPELQQQVLAADWDLTVLDEAHQLHWQPQQAGEDYRFVEALARHSAGLLLLTATPEQLGQASHFARLRLLDPDRFHDLEQFISEQKNFGALNRRLQLLQKKENNAAKIADLLDRHGTGRVLFRNSRASVGGFPARQLHSYPLRPLDNCPDGVAGLYPEQQCEDDSWLTQDPRVRWLEQQLKTLRRQKVLVICTHANTATALEHHLQLRAGIRSAAFHEGLSLLERDRAAAWFADTEDGAQALICSEIGSQGRNFQFAHHLVLFDLPLNPDVLEQRIGRLDRIGQHHSIEIHVPYLTESPQHTLFCWYQAGLNQFAESCSAGFAIYQEFEARLQAQLLAPDAGPDGLDSLVTDTALFTERTRAALREGRDRLLERHSCDTEVAAQLIDEIHRASQVEPLRDYVKLLCDCYGVELEEHSAEAIILRPNEQMLDGHFPALRADGTTATFSREHALAREDMEFLSWEHPILTEAMEQVSSSELGNAALAKFSLKGVPPGTLLLEAIYCTHCIAAKDLQLERFLPLSPLRLLLNNDGKNLADSVPHERLNSLCKPVKHALALQLIKQVYDRVVAILQSADKLTAAHLAVQMARAQQRMQEQLGAEKSRLEQLQAINPNIRQVEIDHLAYRMEACAAHIANASLQLQALRLIIAT